MLKHTHYAAISVPRLSKTQRRRRSLRRVKQAAIILGLLICFTVLYQTRATCVASGAPAIACVD